MASVDLPSSSSSALTLPPTGTERRHNRRNNSNHTTNSNRNINNNTASLEECLFGKQSTTRTRLFQLLLVAKQQKQTREEEEEVSTVVVVGGGGGANDGTVTGSSSSSTHAATGTTTSNTISSTGGDMVAVAVAADASIPAPTTPTTTASTAVSTTPTTGSILNELDPSWHSKQQKKQQWRLRSSHSFSSSDDGETDDIRSNADIDTHSTTDDDDDDIPFRSHRIPLPLLRKIVSSSLFGTPAAEDTTTTSQRQQRNVECNDNSYDDDNSDTPDEGEGWRAVAWRALLGYIPPATHRWPRLLEQRRLQYRTLVARHFVTTTPPPTPLLSSSSSSSGTAVLVSLDAMDTDRALELTAIFHIKKKQKLQKLRHQQQQQKRQDQCNDKEDLSHSSTSGGGGNSGGGLEPEDATATTTPSRSAPQANRGSHGATSANSHIPMSIQQHWKQKGLDLAILNRVTASPYNRNNNALTMNEFSVKATSMLGSLSHPPDALPSMPPPVNSSDAQTSKGQYQPNTEGPDNTTDSVKALDESASTTIADNNTNHTRRLDDIVESALLLDEIRKDVERTHPDMSFFLDPQDNLGQRRYAALERILFLSCHSNNTSNSTTTTGYVQGMNEIVSLLYYVLAAQDPHPEWAIHAEADTYWLWQCILEDNNMRHVFAPHLDHCATGIHGRINLMNQLLARHDPQVKEHLEQFCGIESSFYAIRWWTTLLSREFLFPDTIRLWDSMFASTHKDNFLSHVCVTMIMSIRERLLKGDFSTCLKLLHSFPLTTSMEALLESSRALWVYEAQISVVCRKGGLTLTQALLAIESPPSLILAYGFPNGSPPLTTISPALLARGAAAVERASGQVETSVRSAAQGVMGRARGIYHRYSKDYAKRASSSGSVSSSGSMEDKVASLSFTGKSASFDAIDCVDTDLGKTAMGTTNTVEDLDDIYVQAFR